MNNTDLAFTPALEQARLIRQKELSPLDLTELYLERIARLDPQVGSFFTVVAEQAIADAKTKTEILGSLTDTSQLPPFFGVPTALKDLTAVANLPCSYGSQVLRQQIATYDEGIVTKIRAAGFVILGKTAASEVGSLPYTEPDGFPPTRNPWNLNHTAGGSSGGAAAALAAGLLPVAQGSDGGGSIRIPAACCGVVGLKPSRGRVSSAPVGSRLGGMAVKGPLGRTVADVAALLDVMAGYITGDPFWLPDPTTSFLDATQREIGTLRIAYATSVPPTGEATPAAKQAVLETVKLLENMGHSVEAGCPDFTELSEPFTKVWQASVAASGIPPEALGKINRWLLEHTGGVGEYLQAVRQVEIFARTVVAFFDRIDILVLPVIMHPPMRVGEWADLPPEETLQNIIRWVTPCPGFNASGQPAIALPAGFDENGLPVGVQLVGKPAAEEQLLALAAKLEAARPWGQRPEMSDGVMRLED